MFSKKAISEFKENNLSRNLSILLEQNGLTENELAKQINLPYMTVKRLTSGETSDPRLSTLQLIAGHFNLTVNDIVSEQVPTKANLYNNSPQSVPILDWHDIENNDFTTNQDFSQWQQWQPVALPNSDKLSPHAFALPSKASMKMRYPQNTVFIIDPDVKPQDGDIVLVKILDDGGASLRDLIIDPPNWYLEPIISCSSAIQFDMNKHKVLGTVILVLLHTKKN